MQGLNVEHVQFNGGPLEALLMRSTSEAPPSSSAQEKLMSSTQDAAARLVDSQGQTILSPRPNIGRNSSIIAEDTPPQRSEPAIRLFVAGDRSQVGKSSCCLGILGALLNSGKYAPVDLAYIKPATQCEQTQLVEEFCKHKGIAACVPIGPILYYAGFTRAFLKGQTRETTEQLLRKASEAVDEIARNKKVVLIDGVGYPSVGSITGTDNASVATACGRPFSLPNSSTILRSPVPVLLIGKPGVGDAVDSFNLNATYFSHRNVPVLGAIFNKLSVEGFYSLANCREAIDMYFARCQPERTAFGFVAEIPALINAREHMAKASEVEPLTQALDMADMFVEEFAKQVNVDVILKAAKEATKAHMREQSPHLSPTTPGSKRSASELEKTATAAKRIKQPRPASAPNSKHNSSTKGSHDTSLTRDQIVSLSLVAGAAAG